MGYVFTGDGPGDYAGISVSSAGDIDGDGRDDLIIGAGEALGRAGETYLITAADLEALDLADGTADGVIDLGFVGTAGGYSFTGATVGDRIGYSVSSAGDLDGDGLDDIIISSHGSDDNGSNAGVSYVVTAAELAALDAADGTTDGTIDFTHAASVGIDYFIGAAALDISGYGLSGAGDIDGDGTDDFVIGAPRADAGGIDTGAVYVINAADMADIDGIDGATDGAIDLGNAAGTGSYMLSGEAGGDDAGWSVDSAGDVNNDGYADILIGAPGSDIGGGGAGAAYLVTAADLAGLDGADGAPNGEIDLGNVGSDGGYKFVGADAGDQAGWAVAAAGDVDNDGWDDFLIGAYRASDSATFSGTTYLITADDLAALDAADLSTDGVIDLGNVGAHGGYAIQGAAAGDQSGYSVASAGDVDGDGFADILIGANRGDGSDVDSGTAYLLTGSDLAALDAADGATDGIIDLSHAGSIAGYVFHGAAAGDFAGSAVASAGDIDGDGLDDILIGAERVDGGAADSGASYVLYAKHLEAADAADGTADGVIDLSNAPVCFTRGTRILTDRGEIAVERIAPGDLVMTLDDGPQPVRWIASTTRRAVGRMAPVRIAAGVLGNRRALRVSPQHRMLLRLSDGGEAFAAAIHLVDGRQVRRIEGGTVEYFHLMCDRHQVIFAEGAPVESFFPGPQAWASLTPEGRAELRELFPGLAPEAARKHPGRPGPGQVPGYGGPARAVLRRKEVRPPGR